MNTAEDIKHLIKYWIDHSQRDASVYEEWVEEVQELDPDNTLAQGLRIAAIDDGNRRAAIYEECAKKVQELDQGDKLAYSLKKAANKIYESARYLQKVYQIYSHSEFYE